LSPACSWGRGPHTPFCWDMLSSGGAPPPALMSCTSVGKRGTLIVF
jgi:hypothetical protein